MLEDFPLESMTQDEFNSIASEIVDALERHDLTEQQAIDALDLLIQIIEHVSNEEADADDDGSGGDEDGGEDS